MSLAKISDMEDEFYKTRFRMSFSGLGKLLDSPSQFYQWYVLKNRKTSVEKYLLDGQLTHVLLLQPHKFNDNFVVVPDKLPSDSMIKVLRETHASVLATGAFVYHMANMELHKLTFLDTMVKQNIYQSLKTDGQRLDKVFTPEGVAYWTFLNTSPGKHVVETEMISNAQQRVEIIKLNKHVAECMNLFPELSHKRISINEQLLVHDMPHMPFDLHGIIDNMILDHDKKELLINDLKTTGKPLQEFRRGLFRYRYHLQAVVYKKLGMMFLSKNGLHDYSVHFRFVVVDPIHQVGVFKIEDETLMVWELELDTYLHQAMWHFEQHDFTVPYEFAFQTEVTL